MKMKDQAKRQQIKEWDLEVWTTFAPRVVGDEKATIEYRCICPYCSKEKSKKSNQKRTHNLTAWVFHHTNGDGLGFYCASCKRKHPRVYEFLGKGSAAAEEYAEKRLEIDAVGQGWYCPYPQRWKEISELAHKRRAAKYKADYERKRRENKVAYALREEDKLK